MFEAGPDPNFVDGYADGRHGFPVVRHQSLLDPSDLVSGSSPGLSRERPKIVKTTIEPGDRRLGHGRVYTYLYIGTSPNTAMEPSAPN